jgi:uncharacterized BrkB/YihY/UPF0761 family membrane protein
LCKPGRKGENVMSHESKGPDEKVNDEEKEDPLTVQDKIILVLSLLPFIIPIILLIITSLVIYTTKMDYEAVKIAFIDGFPNPKIWALCLGTAYPLFLIFGIYKVSSKLLKDFLKAMLIMLITGYIFLAISAIGTFCSNCTDSFA